MSMFTSQQKSLQEQFDTARLAEKIERSVIEHSVSDAWKAFIEARDMFFMATVDSQGRPACSYKGGATGFVRVVDASTLVFPLYDGNGLFISAGNIADSGLVELLFVDLENPQRLRVGGRATVASPSEEMARFYHEAKLIVRVDVTHVYVNCKRYVHQYRRIDPSPYVPAEHATTPFAEWKMLPYVQAVLPATDRAEIKRRQDAGEPLPQASGQSEKNPDHHHLVTSKKESE